MPSALIQCCMKYSHIGQVIYQEWKTIDFQRSYSLAGCLLVNMREIPWRRYRDFIKRTIVFWSIDYSKWVVETVDRPFFLCHKIFLSSSKLNRENCWEDYVVPILHVRRPYLNWESVSKSWLLTDHWWEKHTYQSHQTCYSVP